MPLLHTALALLAVLPASFAQKAGTFNVMTFNVAGLPPVLNGNEIPGDKTTNTKRIGELFTQYNISLINVQEDFNFHAALYETDKHPYRTPTSGGVPFGSGLNTLSNFPYSNFERNKWSVCSNIDSADCLTPKGFTFMRVKIAEGVVIDSYNLHADAGTTAADLKARAANLRQVSDFIKSRSTGNAVIVFGDSNTRYTRGPDDIPGVFKDENQMTDAWVELIRNGNAPAGGSATLGCDNPSKTTACETVDKVWYRGSPSVTLKATQFRYASTMFLQADGSILSDHNPVLVDFSWTLSSQIRTSETFGGEFGDWYNDLSTVSSISNPSVSSVTLRGANRLDAIALTLTSGQTLSHGGTGGDATTLRLNQGETLIAATLCRGDKDGKTRVFYAELRTSAGRSIAAGKKTSDCADRTAEQGYAIVGMLGRDGDEIDQLGFVYAKA